MEKAEEDISKAEEFYARDDPLTGIDEVRGVEHAYYEAEKLLQKAEGCVGMDDECLSKGEEETNGLMRPEEEAPLDATMVKGVLKDALVDATNLVQGIEKFLGDLDELEETDIDNAVEVVNNILWTLRDVKDMGFPRGEPPEVSESPVGVAPPDEVLYRLGTTPSPKGEA